MTLPSPTSPFHPLPLSNITLPSTPLTTAALAFVTSNTRPSTVNHCLRSAAFALLLASRLPKFSTAALDIELIVVSVLLHDMGWATSTELLSTDRRFEVDGADVARGWIEGFFSGEEGKEGGEKGKAWDKHRTQLLWDAIALHTTTSIAMYKEGEVAVAHMGISADFWGVYLGTEPGSQELGTLISVDEYKEIVTAFPRAGFKEDMVQIMCGLCKTKPATTFDNFVSEFGAEFGLDGKGAEREKFQEELGKYKALPLLLGNLDRNAEFEK